MRTSDTMNGIFLFFLFLFKFGFLHLSLNIVIIFDVIGPQFERIWIRFFMVYIPSPHIEFAYYSHGLSLHDIKCLLEGYLHSLANTRVETRLGLHRHILGLE